MSFGRTGRALPAPAMTLRRALALTLAIGLAGAAEAQTVCSPNQLGSVVCRGPAARPVPRPPIVSDVQALERLKWGDHPPASGTTLVPARRINRLGGKVIDAPPAGQCRPDALGNLKCR